MGAESGEELLRDWTENQEETQQKPKRAGWKPALRGGGIFAAEEGGGDESNDEADG
jgi:hypothetical protein